MEYSPFAFGNNNPLIFNDALGLMSTPENPQKLEPVYVTAKIKSKSPLNNLNYANSAAWIDRQRGLGYSDDQISGYLNQQHINNNAWHKFNATMSTNATNIRQAERESWETQAEIAEFIAYGLIPVGPVGAW